MAKKNDAMVAITAAADAVAERLDADVYLFNGGIYPPNDRHLASCFPSQRRPAALLLLVTLGGDPHVAYRMARALQRAYRRLSVFISGSCKSAGTLLALGAHEIVMAEDGELGPLDVQLARRDELGEMSSGLVGVEALSALQQRSFSLLEDSLVHLKMGSQGQITLKTALQNARELTVGLMSPIYAQIDPIHLGELGRATRIAAHYGTRLSKYSGNLTQDSLERLVALYPAHEIIIDQDEARELFINVRAPGEDEQRLVAELGNLAAEPLRDDSDGAHAFILRLSTSVAERAGRTPSPPRAAGKERGAKDKARVAPN